ncbi:hypothetical protein NI385_26375 (plasmid) [Vibrio parahaemolyticus]|uniref:Uncharacterized protein n=1 Tax=Vibrio vulnificus TaxID=672 RepID=A0AAN1PWE3_VIBVL|nr:MULTISPECIES: hypothetical protein [Vibrio]EJG0764875.1 hypothetical protein [Vibrio parahaemolyticus O5:K30]AXX63949.1 hypothetical protein FORC53_5610 [Vibrio vulnificus]EGR5926839.1 hypothetical protein [Vibrio parahaemolyticus]KOE81632.1 hypothetical protein ACS91_21155 [Vibrio parahaemolyticus]MCS0115151.1 hypothetical protein [Vibrio parahaemolyticus]
MANIKFEKSGSKANRIYVPALTKVVNLVVGKLLSEHEKLTLTIGFKKLPKNQNAVLKVKNGNTKNFAIHLNKESSFTIWVIYLCHELVHAKQVYTGQLSFGTNNDQFIWNNGSERVELSVASSIQRESDFDLYKDQPWEREAYSLQDELYDFCKKELASEKLDLGAGFLIPLF